MTDEKTKYESIDFRVRSWLVKRISGKHKVDALVNRVDRIVLHEVVSTLHKSISTQVGEMLAVSVVKLPKDVLSQMIAANKHLTDVQKSAIASIFDAPSVDNSARYLG